MNAITKEHIKKIVHKMGKKDDVSNLATAERKMRRMKKELRSDAKIQIEYWLQLKCSELNLCVGTGDDRRRVKNMDDMRLLFMTDSLIENCVNMWNIIFGQFETQKICAFKEYEMKYLNSRNWTYSNSESDRNMKSGFVTKLLLQQKRERLRLLNMAAKQTHKMILCKSRTSHIITAKTRYLKRRKGYCDLNYMIKNLVRAGC